MAARAWTRAATNCRSASLKLIAGGLQACVYRTATFHFWSRSDRTPLACGCGPPRDLVRQTVERESGVGEPGSRHAPGHAPDHGRLLVLDEYPSTGGADVPGSTEAVAAHAGEHDAQHPAAGRCGGGAKEAVGRGAAGILRGAVMGSQPEVGSPPLEEDVTVARGQVDGRRREAPGRREV